MKSILARWRPWQVFTAWCAYWLGLAAVTLTPTALAILRASRLPKDTANVAASFSNHTVSITVSEFGKVTHVVSATTLQAVLWIGLPPLALYCLWIATRSRRRDPVSALGEGPLGDLRQGMPQADASSTHSRAPHA